MRLLSAKPLPAAVPLLDGRSVPLRIVVNPRSRRIALRLDKTSRDAVVTCPSERHVQAAADFALTRAGWIAHQMARLPVITPLEPGAVIPLRGEPHILSLAGRRTLPCVKSVDGAATIQLYAPDAETFATRVRRFLMEQARADLSEAAARHAGALGVSFKTIKVKDTISRWGSCSTTGALSFSWRVVLAPPFVLNYLAAHECAHIVEMNHSARFWSLVAKLDPDYDRAERWLNRHGSALHAIAPKARST